MKPVSARSHSDNRYLVLAIPRLPVQLIKRYGGLLVLVLLSNFITRSWVLSGLGPMVAPANDQGADHLYLLDKAAQHIPDTGRFEAEVRQVAGELSIPAEWLMAVMYAESGFNPAVVNRKGSGAVGLIQFMPISAKELKISLDKLRQMSPVEQLAYVHRYLDTVRSRYGDYQSLTDLYLGILYPKARGQDFCFSLYARPSQAYRQNSGLDENKDGNITVSDIDARMRRLFKEAYGVGEEVS